MCWRHLLLPFVVRKKANHDGDSKFLLNTGTYVSDCILSQLRKSLFRYWKGM